MALVDFLESDRVQWLLILGGAGIVSMVLIDAVIIHPLIWENQPALSYFVAKPLWVGLGLVAVIAASYRYGLFDRTTTLVVGGVAGVVYLQLYYTVIPVPIADGPSVQIGLVGNLTEGLLLHGGAFFVGIAAVLVLNRLREVVTE